MKKLALRVEDLEVVSFAVARAQEARGTVQAHVTPVAVCAVKTAECTLYEPECAVTGGINSCWCSEYASCDCTVAVD